MNIMCIKKQAPIDHGSEVDKLPTGELHISVGSVTTGTCKVTCGWELMNDIH
jgi:hypothetical protein